MRIALTHPYSWPEVRRGAERIIVESSRALAERGHEVIVLTSGGRASRTTHGDVHTVRFRRLSAVDGRHERWFGRRVLPALVAGRFDVVHSMMPWDAVASIRAARLTGHRTVYQDLGNPVRAKVEARADRDAVERVIRDADVYACMSEFSRSFLESDWTRTGSIIPGGVVADRYAPAEREPHPTILFSGALDRPEKCVAELLAAVDVLSRRRPDVRLQLSGPGDVSRILAAAPAAARERTTVLPIGEPGDLAGRYARAWATCLPTEWDSFGLVVIESLAAGTPVVAGPSGAPREVVGPDIGAVAASLAPEALADALDHALGLASQPATAVACRDAAMRFDWATAVAPLLEDLYRG